MYGILENEEYFSVTKDVELANIARQRAKKSEKYQKHEYIPVHKQNNNYFSDRRMKLVFDTESSLHRYYGGYYTDWVCGGQWSRMLSHLKKIVNTCQENNIQVVFFVDGSQQSARRKEWYFQQIIRKERILQIFKHINRRSIGPPKVWWQEPTCLRHCLAAALQMLNVPVKVTLVDHNSEVISYCRDNNVHGIIADHEDFFINSSPIHYFSSNNLKCFANHLETIEYSVQELMSTLNIEEKKLTLLGSLLGDDLIFICVVNIHDVFKT